VWFVWEVSVAWSLQQHFLRFKGEEQEAAVHQENAYKNIFITPKSGDAHLQGGTAQANSK